METAIVILAILAGVVGIAGSILPALPGTSFSWIGLFLLYMWGPHAVPAKVLIIWGVVVMVVSAVDYVVPMLLTKATGGSKYAERGSVIGLLAGIVLTPIGMILGSFLGALVAEIYWGGKDAKSALKAASGSFLGFIMGTGIKTIASCLILWQIVLYSFSL